MELDQAGQYVVKVVAFERLVSETEAVLQDLMLFLGLDPRHHQGTVQPTFGKRILLRVFCSSSDSAPCHVVDRLRCARTNSENPAIHRKKSAMGSFFALMPRGHACELHRVAAQYETAQALMRDLGYSDHSCSFPKPIARPPMSKGMLTCPLPRATDV